MSGAGNEVPSDTVANSGYGSSDETSALLLQVQHETIRPAAEVSIPITSVQQQQQQQAGIATGAGTSGTASGSETRTGTAVHSK